MPLRRDEKRKLGGIAGALAILVGAVLVVIGSWYTFKKWKIIMGLMKKCLKKLRYANS